MSTIKTDTMLFEKVSNEELAKHMQTEDTSPSMCRQKAHLQSKSTEYNIKNNSKPMGLGQLLG